MTETTGSVSGLSITSELNEELNELIQRFHNQLHDSQVQEKLYLFLGYHGNCHDISVPSLKYSDTVPIFHLVLATIINIHIKDVQKPLKYSVRGLLLEKNELNNFIRDANKCSGHRKY